MKKSMTYSCQNRRLLKAERKDEKRRKDVEKVHFSSLSLCGTWVFFFLGGLGF